MNQTLGSEYRHISFTAHYTGYIWYQMGISHPQFATDEGRAYAAMLEPMERWMEWWYGHSIRKTLMTRHLLLDNALQQLLDQNPDLQVLEIAAGLSPRGWWFRQRYPDLLYHELDLPAIAATKQAILTELEPTAPKVWAKDVFHDDLSEVLAALNPRQQLVIISEGLVNYVDKTRLQQLLTRLLHWGRDFRAVHYLTDVYPWPLNDQLAAVFWGHSQLLRWLSQSQFGFYFGHPQELRAFFQQAGWDEVTVVQPSQGSATTPQHRVDASHLGDLVWMVHARASSSQS